MSKKVLSAIIVSLGFNSIAIAEEVVYTATAQKLAGHVLFDQTIEGSGLVTVKPDAFEQSTGDLNALKQCLWSVNVALDSSQPVFTPGKMICIGPNQEVLETIPQGKIEMTGQCATSDCSKFDVTENSAVTLTFSSAINLTLQPRNER